MENTNSAEEIPYNAPQWMKFVSEHIDANIFHHPAWSNLLAKTYNFHPRVICTQNPAEDITAGLPVMEISGISGKKRWISLPFTDHLMPLSNNQAAFESLKQGVFENAGHENVSEIEFRWGVQAPGLNQSTGYVLSRSRLFRDPEYVSKSIAKKDFRNINEARKRGASIEKGTSLQHIKAFYEIHLETRRRYGVPVQPWRFFSGLQKDILDSGLGFVILAHRNSETLAGAVFLHWNNTLTYKYAAATMPGRRLLAGDLVIWEAIQWGCENGFSIFDWGRSDINNIGLRKFKSRWGSEEMPLPYSRNYQPNSDGITRKLMPVWQNVIRKSPRFVCKLTGELFYPFFA